ncbi:MAG: hypothetical protein WDN49_01275, partial [Acetobacteraceae bacterium]
MARISKEDHSTILRMVTVEQRKVAEVAAEYGCTTANIYALVGKLRRRSTEGQAESANIQPPLALDLQAPPNAEMAARSSPEGTAEPPALAPEISSDRLPEVAAASLAPDDANVLAFARAAAPEEDAVTAASSAPNSQACRVVPPGAGGGGTVGAKLAKPGFGLVMRTEDGEESLTPFRSLDDLLSAIKPILRASARSPEPVWFSLQPVDLATIDTDAA